MFLRAKIVMSLSALTSEQPQLASLLKLSELIILAKTGSRYVNLGFLQ